MSLNTQSLQPIINFIWTVADDVLINKFLENQYQDVILPMTVLRRLDLALEPTKNRVQITHVLLLQQLQKFTIFFVYYLLVLQMHIAIIQVRKWFRILMNKLKI